MICILLVAGHGTILETQIKVNQLTNTFSRELQKMYDFLTLYETSARVTLMPRYTFIFKTRKKRESAVDKNVFGMNAETH